MDDFIFLDTNFEYSQTKEYHLSIQVSLDGFSFSIHQSESGNCLALKKGKIAEGANGKPEELILKNLLNEEMFNKSFQSVSTLWVTPKVSLIPTDIFSESLAESSLKLCHPIQKDEKVIWTEHPELKSNWVFSIPESIWQFLTLQFPGVEIHHHLFPFATEALTFKPANHPSVYIHAEQNYIAIFIPEKEGKHFFNTFTFQNTADLVYYILNVFDQRRLNAGQSKLYFSGVIEEGDNVHSLLKKYIFRTEMLPIKRSGKITFQGQSKNQFINLLNHY
ncbi:MAG: DUF3822 family protein [Marinifilaceae bacterium]